MDRDKLFVDCINTAGVVSGSGQKKESADLSDRAATRLRRTIHLHFPRCLCNDLDLQPRPYSNFSQYKNIASHSLALTTSIKFISIEGARIAMSSPDVQLAYCYNSLDPL